MGAMIRTHQLSYRYPTGPTLTFPDVDVPQGAVLLLSGPSGCGKSTWLALAERGDVLPWSMLTDVKTKTLVKYSLEPVTVEGKFAVLNDDSYGLYYRVTEAVSVK